jgi:hypothetical protein
MDQKAYGIIPPDCCLVRLRLDEAEQWVIRQPQCAPAPMEATRAFVTESRKAETLARARRIRIALGVLALMLARAHADPTRALGATMRCNVGWEEAKFYLDWLARVTSKKYRQLNKTESKYVARISPPRRKVYRLLTEDAERMGPPAEDAQRSLAFLNDLVSLRVARSVTA